MRLRQQKRLGTATLDYIRDSQIRIAIRGKVIWNPYSVLIVRPAMYRENNLRPPALRHGCHISDIMAPYSKLRITKNNTEQDKNVCSSLLTVSHIRLYCTCGVCVNVRIDKLIDSGAYIYFTVVVDAPPLPSIPRTPRKEVIVLPPPPSQTSMKQHFPSPVSTTPAFSPIVVNDNP